MIKNILLSTAVLALLLAPTSTLHAEHAKHDGKNQMAQYGKKSDRMRREHAERAEQAEVAMGEEVATAETAVINPPEGAAQKSFLGRVKSGVGGFLSND